MYIHLNVNKQLIDSKYNYSCQIEMLETICMCVKKKKKHQAYLKMLLTRRACKTYI